MWNFWPRLGVVFAFLCAVCPLVAVATPAEATQISDLQAQAAQIEQQITTETNQIGLENERYDQAQGQISSLNTQITATKNQIALDAKKVDADKNNLRSVAVNSYIDLGSQGSSNPLFGGDQKTLAEQQEYGQVATGNLNVAVADLHSAQVQLGAAEANLNTQEQQAQAAANAAQQAEQSAQQQQQQLNATLGSVKGQIATLVAQQQAAAVAAEQAQTAARLAASSSAATANFPPPPPAGGAGTAVAAAETQLGVPYVWGGTDPRGTPGDPSGGFDCSGLVMWAWAQAGVDLPHYSGSQFDDTVPVPVSAMQPGDILFYGPGGDEHEAMYVGGGQMIEAPYTGATVHITPIRLGDGFVGVHRP